MNKDDGGPAIMGLEIKNGVVNITSQLSIRDYFAAQALTGAQQWDAIINGKNSAFAKGDGLKILASIAYAVADAMIAERNK